MRGRKYTSQNREKYGTLERNQTAAERAAENKSEKNIRGMKMDGKNREEQENGAKVRDLEEYKAENRKRKRRRRITVGILAGAILAAGIGTGVWLQLRTFQGYDTVQATETEDTDTYMFQKSGNKIVRYGIDGIELRDRKNQTLWSDHYTMENPQMISCGDAIAIYDKNGTKIVVYDADGKAGEITASYPIVKASVAGQGVVAAILENNGELWMAVSYAYEDGGKMKSQVAFYNFGSRGEDLVDNLASSSSYTDMLCPQIETAGTSSWVAFFDNGFRIYEGTNKPKETVSVSEDGEILSCAYADDRVVLILRGESDDHPYRMKIYNLKGKQLADENLDFYYQNLQIEEKQILLTNRQELCVYTLNGRKKYSGVVSETQIHEILGMGQNRYLLAEEDGVSMIRLK